MSAMREALIVAGIDPNGRAAEVRRYLPQRRRMVRSANPFRKLSDDQVLDARRRFRNGAKVADLADEYDIDGSAMYRMLHGITYWDVTETEAA